MAQPLRETFEHMLGGESSSQRDKEIQLKGVRVAAVRELLKSVRCASSRPLPPHGPTSLLYAGSDMDTWPLNFLQCHEAHVVFADPLIWYRNRGEMIKWHATHQERSRGAFQGFESDDSFYNCPPGCDAPPLDNVDLLHVAHKLTHGMAHRTCSGDKDFEDSADTEWDSSTGDFARLVARETGLSGFKLRQPSIRDMRHADVAAGRTPALEFEFASQGVTRTFSFYMAPAESLNFSHVFAGRPVSTLVATSLQSGPLELTFRRLCEVGAMHSRLRAVSAAVTDGPFPTCMTPHGRLTPRGTQQLLACGCPYSDRNRACYTLTKYAGEHLEDESGRLSGRLRFTNVSRGRGAGSRSASGRQRQWSEAQSRQST